MPEIPKQLVNIWEKVILIFILWCPIIFSNDVINATDSGIPIKNLHGIQIGFYHESHALLIGTTHYKDAWLPQLDRIPDEINELQNTLIQENFNIVKKINPNGLELKRMVQDFIELYGVNSNDRLLFFFSGHGFNMKNSNEGYLVPTDAPDPLISKNDFISKSLSINQLLNFAEKIKAKHTIFLFDSCFKDEIFSNRARTTVPDDVTKKTLVPVQQFITAGNINNLIKTENKNIFVQCLTEAISGNADFNDDQYVTGAELSIYINDKIINSGNNQTPRYGKISGNGDFIFQVTGIGQLKTIESETKFSTFLDVSANCESEFFLNGFKIGKTPVKNYKMNQGKYMAWLTGENCFTYKKWIYAEYGKNYDLNVKLSKKKVPKSKLFVTTRPVDSSIRFINYEKDFYQGIALEANRYNLEVKANGYISTSFFVDISGRENVSMDVRLEKLPANPEIYENSVGMKFVLIYPGLFTMGSPDTEQGRDKDEFQHDVKITHEFYMGITEVTQGQWKLIMGKDPSQFWNCGVDCPVESVSWDDCQLFIKKLNQLEETNSYRLPTEAEWEYASRAGTQTPIFTGNITLSSWNESPELDEVAWYIGNNCVESATKWPDSKYECIRRGIHPVSQKKPNAWGLFDMHGNVYEWCQDVYVLNAYKNHSQSDPVYLDEGPGRVVRGGSWTHYPWLCRSANRDYFYENSGANYIGFRIVKDL